MKRRDFVKTVSAAGAGLLLRSPFSLHAQQPQTDPAVKRVLVMFKCHFDAGFIDTQYNVVTEVLRRLFPSGDRISRTANAAGKRPLCVDHGSWLLYEYLEQASPADRKAMEEAIARRDIAWHALPSHGRPRC